MNTNAELGLFAFSFQLNGKLERLTIHGGPNLLYESTRPVEMAPGRLYTPAGWDECFPTIEPAGDFPVMGDLVGLPPHTEVQPEWIRQTWRAKRFHATRTFRLEAPHILRVDFQALNVSDSPQPVLWANHILWATDRLRRVMLSDGSSLAGFKMDGSERKWFLLAQEPTSLEYPNLTLTLSTDQPWWGIWWDKGGWPVDSPGVYNCLGIEATSTPGEVPAEDWLAPGGQFEGWVRLAVER